MQSRNETLQNNFAVFSIIFFGQILYLKFFTCNYFFDSFYIFENFPIFFWLNLKICIRLKLSFTDHILLTSRPKPTLILDVQIDQ